MKQPSCHVILGQNELPTIDAICLHVAVPLPSVISAGSGGEASWQSYKPLLFTQMAGKMAHPHQGTQCCSHEINMNSDALPHE